MKSARGLGLLLSVAGCVETNPQYVPPEDTAASSTGESTTTGPMTTTGPTTMTTLPPPTTTGPMTTMIEPTTGPDTMGSTDVGTVGSSGPPPLCGDGIEQPGEECDDANLDDTDACLSVCTVAKCGDGFVQFGVEQCEDKNQDDNDACLSDCTKAKCGDGFVQFGVEECDDANVEDADACTNACKKPTCSDGIHNGAETDVDCGGDCPMKCADQKACLSGTDCQSHFCGGGMQCQIAPSCLAIRNSDTDPLLPSGAYKVDFDGVGLEMPIDVYCDMESDTGGWMMVFKVSAGVAGDPALLWQGGPLNDTLFALLTPDKAAKNYVSRFIQKFWDPNAVTEAEARVYVGGAIAKFVTHDSIGKTSLNWFLVSQVKASSYGDLVVKPAVNFYKIDGDGNYGRRFFVNRTYGANCADDGWIVVDTDFGASCPWENYKNLLQPRILYSTGMGSVNWKDAAANMSLGVGDTFTVFVR